MCIRDRTLLSDMPAHTHTHAGRTRTHTMCTHRCEVGHAAKRGCRCARPAAARAGCAVRYITQGWASPLIPREQRQRRWQHAENCPLLKKTNRGDDGLGRSPSQYDDNTRKSPAGVGGCGGRCRLCPAALGGVSGPCGESWRSGESRREDRCRTFNRPLR